ncbi:MAG: helix-turn-helix domain-containing protein, partial [Gammaproteobacteria bacterium]|nr:helix-turn-helix domain-containing protein [Gammaproteobacteria bacterium]
MSRTSFAARGCPVARSLDVIGDAWTLLVVRDLLFGVRRFDALQADLGISRKVLADRLARLREHGIVTRSRYHERPPRYEYWLTRKGLELQPVLLTLGRWSTRWHGAGGEAPLEYVHT